jgi:hypothetical protein
MRDPSEARPKAAPSRARLKSPCARAQVDAALEQDGLFNPVEDEASLEMEDFPLDLPGAGPPQEPVPGPPQDLSAGPPRGQEKTLRVGRDGGPTSPDIA